MVESNIYKKIFIIILCFFCCSCHDNSKVNKFQVLYEKYNKSHLKLDLDDVNFFYESNTSDINKVIESGTGVIFLGDPKDDVSRRVVSVLVDVVSNSDLDKIYYFDSLDGIVGLDSVLDKNIPLVLFVLDGKIVSYHVGTIDGKVDLSEDETIELYNQYLEGVHLVLDDACDEEC